MLKSTCDLSYLNAKTCSCRAHKTCECDAEYFPCHLAPTFHDRVVYQLWRISLQLNIENKLCTIILRILVEILSTLFTTSIGR